MNGAEVEGFVGGITTGISGGFLGNSTLNIEAIGLDEGGAASVVVRAVKRFDGEGVGWESGVVIVGG